MGAFAVGDIVTLPFPFSGEANSKIRPCLILALWPFGNTTDYLVSMITSKGGTDPNAIPLPGTGIIGDALEYPSAIRSTYLFACSELLIKRKIGLCDPALLSQVSNCIKKALP